MYRRGRQIRSLGRGELPHTYKRGLERQSTHLVLGSLQYIMEYGPVQVRYDHAGVMWATLTITCTHISEELKHHDMVMIWYGTRGPLQRSGSTESAAPSWSHQPKTPRHYHLAHANMVSSWMNSVMTIMIMNGDDYDNDNDDNDVTLGSFSTFHPSVSCHSPKCHAPPLSRWLAFSTRYHKHKHTHTLQVTLELRRNLRTYS